MSAVSLLVARARDYYAREREDVLAQFDDLDAELVNVGAYYDGGDVTAAHQACRVVLDRAYDLTGSCDELDALAEAIGFVEAAP